MTVRRAHASGSAAFAGRCRLGPARRSSAESGFTLLETVVAALLLALGIVAVALAQSRVLVSSRHAREIMTATTDLASAVELVASTPFAELTTRFPNGAPIAAYNGLHLRDEMITVSYPNPAAEPLEVWVSITWRDFTGEMRSMPHTAALVRIR